MEESKEKYYSRLSSRLADRVTTPIFFHENNFITDLKEKAELFIHFFSKSTLSFE